MQIQLGINDMIPLYVPINNIKKIYELPYYININDQHKLLKEIYNLFKRINEDYDIIYNDDERKLIINWSLCEVKKDVIETTLKQINKQLDKPKKKKIIIEI